MEDIAVLVYGRNKWSGNPTGCEALFFGQRRGAMLPWFPILKKWRNWLRWQPACGK